MRGSPRYDAKLERAAKWPRFRWAHTRQDRGNAVGDANKINLNHVRKDFGGKSVGGRFLTDAGAGDQEIGRPRLTFQLSYGVAHGARVGNVGDGRGAAASGAF